MTAPKIKLSLAPDIHHLFSRLEQYVSEYTVMYLDDNIDADTIPCLLYVAMKLRQNDDNLYHD